MVWTRADLKNQAKTLLKRNYWIPFLVSLIVALLSTRVDVDPIDSGITFQFSIFSYHWSWGSEIDWYFMKRITIIVLLLMITGMVIRFFFMNPLEVGKSHYYLNESKEKGSLSQLLEVFQMEGYLNIVKILFLRDIKLFLWTLCFIIPGLVKTYEYRMIPFILAEDSTISSKEAFTKTKTMMMNDKFNAVILDLSFFGWLFLGSLLFGIGTFFVYPYIDATEVYLYETLKEKVNV